MIKNELITVVIPTYKRSNKLRSALDSVQRQTYKKIEVIVVDDNADFPSCRKQVEEIVSNYNNVRLIKNRKNLGGALSRNVGVKNASGDIIAFLDDDDEYTPERIEKQYEVYQKHKNDNLGLIFCNNQSYDPKANVVYQHMLKILGTTSTWLIPKKVIEKLGFFEKSPSEQDTIFLLKLLCAGYNVFNVRENLVIRHFHISNDGISGVKPQNIDGTELLRNYCRKNYDKLDNSSQIKHVEYNFSAKLLPKYIYNHRKSEARIEIKNMVTTKPFSIKTIKGLLRYFFPTIFVYKWKWDY